MHRKFPPGKKKPRASGANDHWTESFEIPRKLGTMRRAWSRASPLDVDCFLLRLAIAAGHLDLAGLGLLALGQLDREQTVLESGLDVVAIHVVGQRERADELAIRPLDAVEVLPVLLVLELPLAADRQHAAFHLDVDVIFLESRQLRRQGKLLLVLFDVDRGDPRAETQLLVALPPRRAAAEEAVLKGMKL